jgi:hypothetical protein
LFDTIVIDTSQWTFIYKFVTQLLIAVTSTFDLSNAFEASAITRSFDGEIVVVGFGSGREGDEK